MGAPLDEWVARELVISVDARGPPPQGPNFEYGSTPNRRGELEMYVDIQAEKLPSFYVNPQANCLIHLTMVQV